MKSTILSLRHKLLIAALAVLICGNTPNVFGEADLLELGQASAKYDDVVVRDVLRVDTLRLESGEIVKLIGVRAFGNPARKKKSSDKYGFVVRKKRIWKCRPRNRPWNTRGNCWKANTCVWSSTRSKKTTNTRPWRMFFWSMTTPLLTRGS